MVKKQYQNEWSKKQYQNEWSKKYQNEWSKNNIRTNGQKTILERMVKKQYQNEWSKSNIRKNGQKTRFKSVFLHEWVESVKTTIINSLLQGVHYLGWVAGEAENLVVLSQILHQTYLYVWKIRNLCSELTLANVRQFISRQVQKQLEPAILVSS